MPGKPCTVMEHQTWESQGCVVKILGLCISVGYPNGKDSHIKQIWVPHRRIQAVRILVGLHKAQVTKL